MINDVKYKESINLQGAYVTSDVKVRDKDIDDSNRFRFKILV